jgi:hypothetical protein
MRSSGGRAAWAVLARGHGRVLAAFRECVYLDAAGLLCCVGGERLADGPLNLRLRGDAGLPALLARCAAGTPWHCRGGELVLGAGPGLSLRQPLLWRAPRPAAAAPERLSRALPACRAALRAHSADTGTPWRDVDTGAATRAGVAHRLHGVLAAGTHALARWLDDALERATAATVPPQVLALLGCGPGLTPSGDDVLAGTLVTLHAFARPELARLLSRAIAHHAPVRTGRISAAHLAAAGDGEAVAPVHALLEALRSGDPGAGAACARALLCHGHSSGADALAGIVLTASALLGRSRHHAGSDARCARRVAPASSIGYTASASSSGSR